MQTMIGTPGHRRVGLATAVLGAAVLAAACGGGGQTEPKAAPAAPAAAAAVPARRVFFVEPADGAIVKSPVHFVFGVEGFTISPVPEGTVEHARDGMGHHHLGVDTNCLPEGQPIPKGTPGWVHFGKGDTTIDMQLTPGRHTFALQAGNDLHAPVAGLCEVLTITVEP